MTLAEEIRARLQPLSPSHLEIIDDSARHAGHAGSSGGGHFHIVIVSSQFSGKSPIMRHRLVYQCVEDLIPSRIHALSIQASAPDPNSN